MAADQILPGTGGPLRYDPTNPNFQPNTWGGVAGITSSFNPSPVTSQSMFGDIQGAAGVPKPIAPPALNPYKISNQAINYPTFLRNLGENQAQRNFEQSVNRASMGNSAQQFSRAQDQRNNQRLGYMAQAGAADMQNQQILADQQNQYNQLIAALFNSLVGQRGQDLDYMKPTSQGGGGRGVKLGGGNSQRDALMAMGGEWGGTKLGTGAGPGYGFADLVNRSIPTYAPQPTQSASTSSSRGPQPAQAGGTIKRLGGRIY